MSDYQIVTVDQKNVDEYGFFCIKNNKHPGYIAKREWLERRFEEGMRIKLIITKEGKQAGFLEYIPGEFTWRAVNAPGYLVIHCIWVNSVKFPYRGMASALVEECTRKAVESGKNGVAVVTSDGTWMAGRDLFIKNGFELVDEAAPHYQLLAKKLGKGPLPSFPKNWEVRLDGDGGAGLQLLYTNQCPFIGKAVAELPPVAEEHGIDLQLIELNDPAEARDRMPSPYGVFSLLYRGRLLADHPISATRFKNIIRKELKPVVGTSGIS